MVWVSGFAPGALAVAILLVNNIRDREQDLLAGKKTLIVRMGRGFGEALYAVCGFVACGIAVLAWSVFGAPVWILASLLVLPLMVRTFGQLRSIPDSESVRMNPILALTARNLLLFSLLFSIGLILGRIL
jgi:1,4-dihydroxy-2-naphthoate octaprenyltransferase